VTEPIEGVPRRETGRLVLRAFGEEDVIPYHALFNDPEVTRYLPMQGEPVSMERIERAIERGREHWAARGYGIWAVEDAATSTLIGQCGLQHLEDVGEVEVLYALARSAWGRGLATEAADAAVRFGFDEVGLRRIVAYVVAANTASAGVVRKLGMELEAVDVDIFGLTCDRYGTEATADRG
jgi:ribosomal-protein-alanine N-acetyltransferase